MVFGTSSEPAYGNGEHGICVSHTDGHLPILVLIQFSETSTLSLFLLSETSPHYEHFPSCYEAGLCMPMRPKVATGTYSKRMRRLQAVRAQ